MSLHVLPAMACIRQIHLVHGDQRWLVQKSRVVHIQLSSHEVVAPDRILAGAIDNVKNQTRSLDVAQKTVAKAMARVRAFDQPWYVDDDKRHVADYGDAQVRRQRCKWIVGNLRMGRAERRQKARFAGVRLPHQPNVADGFQLEGERPLFAGLALTRHARRPVRAGCEMDVSQAALSTPCHDDLLIIVRQVGEEMLALVHRGSEGNVDDEIRPALSVLERAGSVAAPLRGEARPMSEW